MLLRRRRRQYQHLTEFERGCVIGLREGGFSFRDISERLGRDVSILVPVVTGRYSLKKTGVRSHTGHYGEGRPPFSPHRDIWDIIGRQLQHHPQPTWTVADLTDQMQQPWICIPLNDNTAPERHNACTFAC
ncbi:hypothetical protein AVEN_42045-1 [Araneus ventricosus]|uniref:Transposase IS30-like HTH domain-containing protein n=1 Tax=Araneus ventricosus TaxID=182803 RepID=A0A4Y2GF59_ARAVE|nr:hypothetical protein AVEN_42045-1 [Araneus ventricosus]